MIPAADERLVPRELSKSAQQFSLLQRKTHCIFARQSKIWGPPPWRSELTFEANIALSRAAINDFVTNGESNEVDGFVYTLPDPSSGATLNDLCRTTWNLLSCLSSWDKVRQPLDEDIESPSWFFALHGHRLFVLTAAPCYDAHHSRYSYGSPFTFVLLQPDHAFKRRHTPGVAAIAADTRNIIRDSFTRNDQSYDLGITLGLLEAHRFVKPIKLGDPPVRWWLTTSH